MSDTAEKHSLLPWSVGLPAIAVAGADGWPIAMLVSRGDMSREASDQIRLADAEFIVKAVNHHDELVAALKDAVEWMNDRRELAEIVPAIARALDVLAKVK